MPHNLIGLDISIIEEQIGRIIPALPNCDLTPEEGFKRFRENLGRALTDAQDAVAEALPEIAAAVEAQKAVAGLVDGILVQNPDPTTPNSIDTLMDSVGAQKPTTERETLEQRLGDVFDLNVVDGILFPKGSTDLSPLRRLFQALELVGECSLPDTTQPFIFVTSYSETKETVTGSTCGEDIVSFEVSEAKIGENISLQKASEISGVPEEDILIRFFWIDRIRADVPTQVRLLALGLSGEDLGAILAAPKDTGRVFSTIIDSSLIETLQKRLSDEGICTMMNRNDTGGLNVDPTSDDVIKSIRSTLNSNTGSNRNKAGIGEGAITPEPNTNVAPAGRADDPALMMLATVNLAQSLGIERTEDCIKLDGQCIETEGLDDLCLQIFNFINEAISSVESFIGSVADLTLSLTALGNANLGLSLGLGFASCLASFNLGLDISLSLSIGLPFQVQLYLAAFTAVVAAVSIAVTGMKAFLCIPQAVIQLLFGGLCGFKPFDFDTCPAVLGQLSINTLIDRLNNLLQVAIGLVGNILSSLQVMRADADSNARASADLVVFSLCAVAALPLGIGLGLAGVDREGDLASVSGVASPTGVAGLVVPGVGIST